VEFLVNCRDSRVYLWLGSTVWGSSRTTT